MKSKRGFTLIELLIVIALLGALAVGLIGAIDPFEQLKKGTDTATRDLVSQVQTAVLRYYSVKNAMPWPAAPAGTAVNLENAGMHTMLGNITSAGELVTQFEQTQATKLKDIWVNGYDQTANTSAQVIVCYMPTAKSFQADPNTKYTINGGDQAAGYCISDTTAVGGAAGTHSCYWCIR